MEKNNKKILYIVREEINIKKIDGYTNIIVNDPILGLKQLKEKPILIVIDLGINKVPGVDIIKVIRNNIFYYHTKIAVFLKKYNLRLLKNACISGADYYLESSIDYNLGPILGHISNEDYLANIVSK